MLRSDAEQAKLRKLWRDYHDLCDWLRLAWRQGGCQGPAPKLPPIPENLRNLACGAKTRQGGTCKLTNIYTNGRCKFHGGLSTGPKTRTGRQKSNENLTKRWKPMDR